MKWLKITPKGYVWDNRIFLVAILIMFSFVGYQIYKNGINSSPYIVCDKDLCINPLKESKCSGFACSMVKCTEDWCQSDTLTRGTYGKKPFNNGAFLLICVSLICIALWANHNIHNKGKKIDIDFENSPLGKIINKASSLEKNIKDDNETTNNQGKQ